MLALAWKLDHGGPRRPHKHEDPGVGSTAQDKGDSRNHSLQDPDVFVLFFPLGQASNCGFYCTQGA